jgi:hypothetical protein
MTRQLEEAGCQMRVLWFSRLTSGLGSKLTMGTGWITFPVPPFYAAHRLICRATRFMCRLLVRVASRAWGIELIVAENPTMAAISVGNGVSVICDFHGDVVEERKMNANSEWEIRLAQEDERVASRETAGWVCASDALRQVLSARYGISAPAAVVPCCVEIARYAAFERRRQKAREQLGLGSRWVVCYMGGLSIWQEIPHTLSLVAAMRAKEPRLFLLLITRDSTDMYASQLAVLGEEGKDYARLSLSHEEVLEKLPAADLGMLLRAPSPVNYVSSPTKCGEYLASGVSVLTTAYAGDASRVISETGAGVVLNGDPNSEENVELALSFLRASMVDRVSVARRSHLAAIEHYNEAHSVESVVRLLAEVLLGD